VLKIGCPISLVKEYVQVSIEKIMAFAEEIDVSLIDG